MRCSVVAAIAAFLILPVQNARAALRVGDPAPPIVVTEWVKQNPFESWAADKPIDFATATKGKIVVLEFWATWCGPCVQLIPHSNEFNNRYKDKGILFIALTDSTQGQSVKMVQDFVSRRGDGMNYPVGYDRTQKNHLAYVIDSGALGIPHVVVIGKDGRIAWMGHPVEPAMEEVIKDLLLDRYDLDAIAKRRAIEARIKPLSMEFNRAASRGDWEKCLSLADDMLEIDPANREIMQYAIQIAINEMHSPDRLRQWVQGVLERQSANSEALALLARLLVESVAPPDRALDLALQAAETAYRADNSRADSLGALALVVYNIGDVDRAIELQQQALSAANDLEKDDAQKMLTYYETCRSLKNSQAAK